MTQSAKRNPVLWLSTLLLAFALLLSGCSGSSGSGSSAQGSGSSGSGSGSGSSSAPEETTDFRKYNAYSDVASDIYQIDGLLVAYFTVVQDQPEFALVDGMDYSLLSDVFSDYMPSDYIISSALDYNEEEPSYPEQDSLLLALEQPYKDMLDVMSDLCVYLTYENYLEDDMAQAAELHTRLYQVITPFDEAAWPFVDSMNTLDEQTEQMELDRLQSEGMNIAFYSRTMLNLCDEIDAEIWAQLENAETLPVLDMTNLESLYTQYQEAYNSLMEALNDPEQVKKVTSWNDDAYWSDVYHDNFTNAVDALNTALTAFMDAARSQAEYGQSYDEFYAASSTLIEEYNTSIV